MDRQNFLLSQPEFIKDLYAWMGAEIPLAIAGLPIFFLFTSYFTALALKDRRESFIRFALRPFNRGNIGGQYFLWLGLSIVGLYFFAVSHSIIRLMADKVANG